MPIYNTRIFVKESIESIIGQTFTDFELIIIDDGSTDGSSEVLENFQKSDNRIHVYKNKKNSGIVASLNRGLSIATGEYIARMDADDICFPTRLQKQVDFLEDHPHIGILGCAIQYISSTGEKLGTNFYPSDDLAIRWTSLFASPFAHPTVVIRKCILEKYELQYNPTKQNIEDYDLWIRLLAKTRGANLKDILLRYRIHSMSITSKYSEKEIKLLTTVSYDNISELFPELSFSRKQIRTVVRSLMIHQNKLFQRNDRAEAAIIYLNAWNAFAVQHPMQETQKLQKEVTLVASKMILIPFFQKKMLQALFLLFKVDPFWPISFFLNLPSIIIRKIVSITIARLKYIHGQS